MKVLYFSDSSIEDLYSLSLLVSQAHFKKLKLLGIVCDDGLFSYPQNVSVSQFWLSQVLQVENVPFYKGIDRSAYAKQQRDFPPVFSSGLIRILEESFDYRPSSPTADSLARLASRLDEEDDRSVSVLTTGNLTTLSSFLDQNLSLKRKIKEVFVIAGNYQVPGNVLPANFEQPRIVADAEYNAWLDPDSLRNVIHSLYRELRLVPLDCTNYAPLNKENLLKIEREAEEYLPEADPFIRNAYSQCIKLMDEAIKNVGGQTFMRVMVGITLLFRNSQGQKRIQPQLDVDWTGRLVKSWVRCRNSVRTYNFMEESPFLSNVVKDIFLPQDI